jgi:hypothetical protein
MLAGDMRVIDIAAKGRPAANRGAVRRIRAFSLVHTRSMDRTLSTTLSSAPRFGSDVAMRPAPLTFFALPLLGCNLLGGDQPVTQDAGPAPVTATPAQVAKPLPPGRTPVPAPDEYAAAREVTVKGSSALHCETKMVREWLRVSCRGANDTGGTPTAVTVTRGDREETVLYAAGGVTSMITPVLEGTEIEALFSWTDKRHSLVVKWPAGRPKPIVLGEFLGAASPL